MLWFSKWPNYYWRKAPILFCLVVSFISNLKEIRKGTLYIPMQDGRTIKKEMRFLIKKPGWGGAGEGGKELEIPVMASNKMKICGCYFRDAATIGGSNAGNENYFQFLWTSFKRSPKFNMGYKISFFWQVCSVGKFKNTMLFWIVEKLNLNSATIPGEK